MLPRASLIIVLPILLMSFILRRATPAFISSRRPLPLLLPEPVLVSRGPLQYSHHSPHHLTNTQSALNNNRSRYNTSLSLSSMSKPNYWNREKASSEGLQLNNKGEMSRSISTANGNTTSTVVKPAKIITLCDPSDGANSALKNLPEGAEIVATGKSVDDFNIEELREQKANVIYVSYVHEAAKILSTLITKLPSVEWIHARSAGIDFITSPEFGSADAICTNAKGQFSSTLAEYTLMACSYFAKDLPRLIHQKKRKEWIKYDVKELRGSTLGIIGYGDIGQACAKLAKVYGMKILALRRNPTLSEGDPFCDKAYGTDRLNDLMGESDYILVSAPLTEETRGLVGKEALKSVKKGAVFINVGRGPIVDEEALIEALQDGRLLGAALDVFSIEPLPRESPLWYLDNVLMSPHNMDQTATFMHEACEFFVNENLPRFLSGRDLYNPVDKAAGY